MSWQENRRRKRTWYRHYKRLCDQLVELVRANSGGTPIAGEAIIKMFFDLYEERRMHKRRRVANSAWESFELAARDSGLTRVALMGDTYTPEQRRPPAIGEFGAQSRTSTAEPRQQMAGLPAGYVPADGRAVEAIKVTGITWVEDSVIDLPKPGGGAYVTGVPGKEKEDIMRMKDNRDKSRPF